MSNLTPFPKSPRPATGAEEVPVATPPVGAGEGEERVEAANSPDLRSLYAERVKIFPAKVSGFFRRLKWWLMAVLLGIYWVTPWLRWDRGPNAPDQAVLIDLANRRFYFFFIEIWPQEFYYVAGLLIMAGLGLFLATSVAGRAWCGYACPQTVWTDLYMAVERWIEGDRNARIKLDKAPWSLDKLRKRVAVYTLWLVIAVATGGAWVFYFADAPSLARDLVTFNAAPVAYSTIGILTATTFIFAGFMREQVCTYMCPWPRIQGAMIDEQSLIVTYNDWRGEPRTRGAKRAAAGGIDAGDCIDCNACVAVCPMGIDIRDGQQLECITCALCIDACDTMMEKVGKPKGLIAYSTLRAYDAHVKTANDNGRAAATADQQRDGRPKMIRARTVIYGTLWSLIGVAMLVTLSTRTRISLSVLHDRAPPFVVLSDGAVRNGYTLKLANMRNEAAQFLVSLEGIPDALMWVGEERLPPARAVTIDVGPDRVREVKVYVSRPAGSARAADFAFIASEAKANEMARKAANFEAKGR